MSHLCRCIAAAVLCLSLCLTAGCQSAPSGTSSSLPAIDASSPPDASVQTSSSVVPPAPNAKSEPEATPEPEVQPEPETPPEPEVTPEPEPEIKPQPKPTNNTRLYILMYHHMVPDGTNCNDWTITTSRFREDLQWLQDNGYTWLLPSELAAGEPLPEKAVLITFDDGYASNYELTYPILQEFNAKIVISVITKRIEDGKTDFLTWDMCREMAQSGLVEFGSHTHSFHSGEVDGILRLPEESRAEYEARMFPDLQTSIDLIEANTGTEVCFFAYPHGRTEAWAEDFIQENFDVTVTTQHGPASIKKGLYELPRHNITVNTPVGKYLP